MEDVAARGGNSLLSCIAVRRRRRRALGVAQDRAELDAGRAAINFWAGKKARECNVAGKESVGGLGDGVEANRAVEASGVGLRLERGR